MPTQLNERRGSRSTSLHAKGGKPMFTKEWSIPVILTVFLLSVCGLIAYLTWSLMPPAKAAEDHIGASFNLIDDRGQPMTAQALKGRAAASRPAPFP